MEKKKIALDTKIDFKGLTKGKKKGGKPSDTEYTTRSSINLARKERDPAAQKKLTILGVVALVAVVLIVKFGFVDQYSRLHQAQAEYDAVHQQNVEIQEQLKNYEDVKIEYRSYSMEWMTPENDRYVSVDRQTVLDLIETVVMPRGTVNSFDISKNIVDIRMSNMTLKEISAMFDVIEKSPYVVSVTLNGAENQDEANVTLVEFSVTITLISGAEGEEGAE